MITANVVLRFAANNGADYSKCKPTVKVGEDETDDGSSVTATLVGVPASLDSEDFAESARLSGCVITTKKARRSIPKVRMPAGSAAESIIVALDTADQFELVGNRDEDDDTLAQLAERSANVVANGQPAH